VVFHHLHTDHQNRIQPCQPAAARHRRNACATSRPSTPSCDWWRLFAARLGSGAGRCRR
jgi:hypothetical protein